jgi:hypothetical protein
MVSKLARMSGDARVIVVSAVDFHMSRYSRGRFCFAFLGNGREEG